MQHFNFIVGYSDSASVIARSRVAATWQSQLTFKREIATAAPPPRNTCTCVQCWCDILKVIGIIKDCSFAAS